MRLGGNVQGNTLIWCRHQLVQNGVGSSDASIQFRNVSRVCRVDAGESHTKQRNSQNAFHTILCFHKDSLKVGEGP